MSYLSDAWNKFEWKVYSVMPGLKTYICMGLQAIGATAFVAKDYVAQLPLDKFATGTQIAVGSLILSLLALWFHNMGDRVDS
jgi:hypothetical protein